MFPARRMQSPAGMKTNLVLKSILFGATLLTLNPVGQAQPVPAADALEGRARNNQYAVKILCGRSQGEAAGGGVVAPGTYFTAVNVHNPGRSAVAFIKKVALANPWQKPGKISKFVDGKLGPDEAMEVDCRELAKMGGVAPGTLFGGYLVFETREGTELDIVAVYTTAGNAGVSALHTERVAKRQIP